MLRRVALVRTDVLEGLSASIIRVTRIGELGTTLAVTSHLVFLRSVRRLLVTESSRYGNRASQIYPLLYILTFSLSFFLSFLSFSLSFSAFR
jgi:hypothetical protein